MTIQRRWPGKRVSAESKLRNRKYLYEIRGKDLRGGQRELQEGLQKSFYSSSNWRFWVTLGACIAIHQFAARYCHALLTCGVIMGRIQCEYMAGKTFLEDYP